MTNVEILTYSWKIINTLKQTDPLIKKYEQYINSNNILIFIDSDIINSKLNSAFEIKDKFIIHLASDYINEEDNIDLQLVKLAYLIRKNIQHILQYIVMFVLSANAVDTINIYFSFIIRNKLELNASLIGGFYSDNDINIFYDFILDCIEEYEYYNE